MTTESCRFSDDLPQEGGGGGVGGTLHTDISWRAKGHDQNEEAYSSGLCEADDIWSRK